MAAIPNALEPVTITCAACHGTGYAPIAVIASCSRCGASWQPARIAAHMDNYGGGWWGYRLIGDLLWQLFYRLPCKHRVDCLEYHAVPCATCRGVGTFTHWQLTARSQQRQQQRQRWMLAAEATPRPIAQRNPALVPMHTPLLADERTYDWQRGRWWPSA